MFGYIPCPDIFRPVFQPDSLFRSGQNIEGKQKLLLKLKEPDRLVKTVRPLFWNLCFL